MNLGRAKLILIVAFVGLNLFLGYHLFWPNFGRLTRVAVTSEDLRNTESLLRNKNYNLEASIVRAIQTSDFLTVSSAQSIRDDIITRLTDLGTTVIDYEDRVVYHSLQELVVIHANGLIQITYNPAIFMNDDSINMEERNLKNYSDHLLEDKRLKPEGIVFDYLEKSDDGQIVIYYHQVHDGMPLYAGQVRVIIRDDHVISIEIYWLEPTERTVTREMEVLSATEALTNLVNELGPSTVMRNITRVNLGYFSREFDAEKWEVPPVWRIMMDNKQKYYINAFTGNLEQDIIMLDRLP